VDRGQFQQLSKVRLKEARALLKMGLSDGAYYLAGYAVEFALKACIAKETQRYEFPDKKKTERSYSHVLKDLGSPTSTAPAGNGRESTRTLKQTGTSRSCGPKRAATSDIQWNLQRNY
jgi:hypothetical protein